MNNSLPKTTLLLFLFIIAFAAFWLPAKANEPTAVHLASFEVVPLDNAVRIEWSTGSELNTAGFKIKRASANGNELFLDYIGDNGFVAATGDSAIGVDYSATDDQVQNGSVYTYILIEYENSGTESELARETVTVGISPTNTPVVISGGTGSGSTNSTTTPTPKSTTSASASATPSATANANEPTNTPQFSATITPKSVQPTASPTKISNSTGLDQTNSSANSSGNESVIEETTGSSLTGVSEVFAQEENSKEVETLEIAAQPDLETDQLQDEYPEALPTTAVIESVETYPENNATTIDEQLATPVPIIGSNQGYTGTEQDSPTNATNSSSTASSNQGRAFLWIGFIVALLIFATGLIGSIILFTRKSK